MHEPRGAGWTRIGWACGHARQRRISSASSSTSSTIHSPPAPKKNPSLPSGLFRLECVSDFHELARSMMGDLNQPDYSALQDLYDAYQLFIDSTLKPRAFNLDVCLMRFMHPCFLYKDQQPSPPKASYRTQYINGLDYEHFDCLLSDTLHVLFKNFSRNRLSKLATLRAVADDASVYQLLRALPEKEFFSLLVEMAFEYHGRDTQRHISLRGWTVYSFTSLLTYDLDYLLPYNEENITRQNNGFLRRAFRTRPGSWISSGKIETGIDQLFPETAPVVRQLMVLLAKNAARPAASSRLGAIPEYRATVAFDATGDVLQNEQNYDGPPRFSIDSSSERSFVTALSQGLSSRHSLNSALSNHLSSQLSFSSALSKYSRSLRLSKDRQSIDTFLSLDAITTTEQSAAVEGPYRKMLQERNLIPESLLENDWSGRGQNAEYQCIERDQIPLTVERVLGETRNATVESVRCRRVRLVRKTVAFPRWSKRKREDALQEVQHLYRVQHSHIVRLVGTYVIDNELAILTYPCADWNLEDFIKATQGATDLQERFDSISHFFTCLAQVLAFMHALPLKHMDIKPQNLLVRDIRHFQQNNSPPYKIYLTDFGISRAYPTIEDCETESATSFTRMYAAREVVLQEPRGLPADVFSLGCVYAELLAAALDAFANLPPKDTPHRRPPETWDSLREARDRSASGPSAYYSCVAEVQAWLSQLPIPQPELRAVRAWTIAMLSTEPSLRPAASDLAEDPDMPPACPHCTLHDAAGPEDFEAADAGREHLSNARAPDWPLG